MYNKLKINYKNDIKSPSAYGGGKLKAGHLVKRHAIKCYGWSNEVLNLNPEDILLLNRFSNASCGFNCIF